MKINTHLLLFVLFFMGITLPAIDAQEQLGIYWNVNNPLGAYAEAAGATPMGISINLLVPIKKLKGLHVGGELGVGMLHKTSYQLSDPSDLSTFEVDEEDCYLSYRAIARYQLDNRSIWTPYAEVSLGGTSYFSTLLADDSDEVDFDNKTEFHGTALNVGLGGGMAIKLSDCLSLDMGVAYLAGTRTHYRSIDPEVEVKQSLQEGVRESITDSVNCKLGILIGF